jgi:hypothetical protein
MADLPPIFLPVEFAIFSAGVGAAMLFFGVGMAAYMRLAQSAIAIPSWTWEFAAAGLGLLLLTAAAYFFKLIQFVRQRDVDYDSFFWNLPIESPDHPAGAGDLFNAALARWPHLALVLFVLILALRDDPAARNWLNYDLGPIHNGGQRWSIAEVLILGGVPVALLVVIGLALRRIWAMQSDGAHVPENRKAYRQEQVPLRKNAGLRPDNIKPPDASSSQENLSSQ